MIFHNSSFVDKTSLDKDNLIKILKPFMNVQGAVIFNIHRWTIHIFPCEFSMGSWEYIKYILTSLLNQFQNTGNSYFEHLLHLIGVCLLSLFQYWSQNKILSIFQCFHVFWLSWRHSKGVDTWLYIKLLTYNILK